MGAGQVPPVERLRTVEFYRDWGLPISITAATENLLKTSVQLNSRSGNTVQYRFETYRRSDDYTGVRNSIVHKGDYGNWHLQYESILPLSTSCCRKVITCVPIFDVSHDFPKLGNHRIGAGYTLDHNYTKYKQYDSLNTGSYSFEIWQAYIKSPAGKPNKWGVTYYTRSDKYPYLGNLGMPTE